jgi:esterase/lipase
MGVECNRMCDTVLRDMHQLACPLFVVHSTKDNMTDPDGSKMLVNAAKVSILIIILFPTEPTYRSCSSQDCS